MKAFLRKICPDGIHSCYARTKFWLRFHFHPEGIANELHKAIVGYDIDWKNPKTLNEKINWMKFNYNTKEWTRLADKYLVREYVEERIGAVVLPKLYAVWQNASEIDFTKLPESFILKTNHGCHTVIPVPHKDKVDVNSVKQQFAVWMKKQYGYDTAEPHYMKIKPLIIAEELLVNDSAFSDSLVDYKVYCFDGKPYCILVCSDRRGQDATLSYYDCDWNPLPEALRKELRDRQQDVPKPKCLKLLLNYASALSKGHPQVRVDFYIVSNRIYFGEMTFTMKGGYNDDISKEFCLELGKQVKLPKESIV